MVGALLEIGWSRRTVEGFRALIEHPRPGAPIQTAPASGLTLEHVYYRRSPLW
jgi:tRNA U38,U39,U40 pseudouridine synthase TruA